MTRERPSEKLKAARLAIAEHMDAICNCFKRPSECKITVIVRNPYLADGDVVMTNDDFDIAAAALKRLKEDAAITLPAGEVTP